MTDFDFVENPVTTGCYCVRKHIFYTNMIVSFVVYWFIFCFQIATMNLFKYQLVGVQLRRVMSYLFIFLTPFIGQGNKYNSVMWIIVLKLLIRVNGRKYGMCEVSFKVFYFIIC